MTARHWGDRIEIVSARCPEPPASALLPRPDGHIAWAAQDHAAARAALTSWFGHPAGHG